MRAAARRLAPNATETMLSAVCEGRRDAALIEALRAEDASLVRLFLDKELSAPDAAVLEAVKTGNPSMVRALTPRFPRRSASLLAVARCMVGERWDDMLFAAVELRNLLLIRWILTTKPIVAVEAAVLKAVHTADLAVLVAFRPVWTSVPWDKAYAAVQELDPKVCVARDAMSKLCRCQRLDPDASAD